MAGARAPNNGSGPADYACRGVWALWRTSPTTTATLREVVLGGYRRGSSQHAVGREQSLSLPPHPFSLTPDGLGGTGDRGGVGEELATYYHHRELA